MPKIALLPGDGIGPEIMEVAVMILDTIAQRFQRSFSYETLPVGGEAIDRYQNPLPAETLQAVKQADAVLLAAVGGPKWDNVPAAIRPEAGLLKLRKELGVYANLRPVVAYDALLGVSPLRPETLRGADILIVRELTGGIYFGEKKREKTAEGEKASDVMVYETKEIERIVRMAFSLAQKRKGRLASVDKANVLETSRLWRETVNRLAPEYPDVQVEHVLVDNCAMQLIRDPRRFDVIVTENMFGDILSDEAAMLTGSIGMLPSASLGADVNLYEPVHGSAPDIAGQGIANPAGIILSVAMMLRHSFGWEKEARTVEEAVQLVLNQGFRTKDLSSEGCQTLSTKEFGRRVMEEVKNLDLSAVL